MVELFVGVFGSLVNTAFYLLALRLLMEVSGINQQDPIPAFLTQTTKWTGYVERLIGQPKESMVNQSTLLLLVICGALRVESGSVLESGFGLNTIDLFAETILHIAGSILLICKVAVFGSIVSSILSKLGEMDYRLVAVLDFCDDLAKPLIRGVRKILPDMGKIDLSPLVTFHILLLVGMAMNGIYSLY